ncbi:hypothetical protein TrLO_g13992, partial [Triparma laevis f. longispina]
HSKQGTITCVDLKINLEGYKFAASQIKTLKKDQRLTYGEVLSLWGGWKVGTQTVTEVMEDSGEFKMSGVLVKEKTDYFLENTPRSDLIKIIARLTAERDHAINVHHESKSKTREDLLQACYNKIGHRLAEAERLLSAETVERKVGKVECERYRRLWGEEKERSKSLNDININTMEENKKLRSEINATKKEEERLKIMVDRSKTRLEEMEAEIRDHVTTEAQLRREGGKLKSQLQTSIREIARQENRTGAVLADIERRGSSWEREVTLLREENEALKDRVRKGEEEMRIYAARVGGVWEGMGMVGRSPSARGSGSGSTSNLAESASSITETQSLAGSSVTSRRSRQSPRRQASAPHSPTISRQSINEEGEEEEETSSHPSTYPPNSVADNAWLRDRLENITNITNEILSDED